MMQANVSNVGDQVTLLTNQQINTFHNVISPQKYYSPLLSSKKNGNPFPPNAVEMPTAATKRKRNKSFHLHPAFRLDEEVFISMQILIIIENCKKCAKKEC